MKKIIFFAGVLVALALGPALKAAAAETEPQMGDDVYQQLKSEGKVVSSSPLYDTLRPIAEAIARVIQPKYQYPIHFYIVHDAQPNAFAAPGGNIYVVDSLFYFVHNTEELAGTICHETSHLIHHDSVKKIRHDDLIRVREVAAAALIGPSFKHLLAISSIGALDSLHYSRDVEEAADLTGADTCAAAGVNPWGLVWLFQDFQDAHFQTPPEFLSDHPGDAARITALEKHFKQSPATFAQFNSNPSSAKPLKVPKHASEKFVH